MHQLKKRKVLDHGHVRLESFVERKLTGVTSEREHDRSFFGFFIKAPMFVVEDFDQNSQWFTPVNEFYTPTSFQDDKKNPLSEKDNNVLYTKFSNFNTWSFNFYTKLTEAGMSKDQAKRILPSTMYGEFYWQIGVSDLLDWLHSSLNPIESAELKQYATVILDFLFEYAPLTARDFVQKEFNRE